MPGADEVLSIYFISWTIGQSVGRNDLLVTFLRGARQSPHLSTIPTWDLALVLKALTCSPFVQLQLASLKVFSFKMALLLALVSVQQVGDIHALSVNESCIDFGPDESSSDQEKVMFLKNVLNPIQSPGYNDISLCSGQTICGEHFPFAAGLLCTCSAHLCRAH